MMVDKSSSTTNDSLSALLPRRSKTRVVIWIAVFAVAVWCAWVTPAVLHPDVRLDNSAASSSVSGTPFLLENLTVSADGWPSLTIVGVNGFPGASVVAARVANDDQANKFFNTEIDDRPATLDSLLAEISAKWVPVSQLQALPAKIADGATANLLIVWKITDCKQALAHGDESVLHLDIRSSFGIERTVTFPRDNSYPELFVTTSTSLKESGVC